ncbi:gamma glutamyl transpeptidase [Aspergillus arachidicola]|uniref:Glutathione hydrolase n=1 Tax=Aspergillus arachidicola TaxID=656916 RepID=A0A2G7GBG5_9EURO|nr:gamma glutamyl transpeptidase [Aspergillus arachidicola]
MASKWIEEQPLVHRRDIQISRKSRIAASLLVLLVLWRYGLPSSTHFGFSSKEPKQLGAVASEHALCSRYGADMLERGGNAADAMVATMFCIGVVGMYHSGIGGGGFMLIKSPDGAFEFVDFRETAPAAIVAMGMNTSAGLRSGVPGEVRGLEYLHRKYGVLPWSVVLEPAIRTARDGFLVQEDLVNYIDMAVEETGEDFMSNNPSWAVDFSPSGSRVRLGETMTRRRLAATLERISADGPDAFYSGPIAEDMIAALRDAGGIMTLEDLANYTVVTRDTSHIDYRGYQITSTTAPSSGTIAMNILKVLGTYDEFFTPGTTELSTHRMIEAMKFAFGLRTRLGDPSFVTGMEEYENHILSAEMIDHIRQSISDSHTQDTSAYNPDGLEVVNSTGTAHIAAVDHQGLAISATTTINRLFGNQIMCDQTGIIMNNEMDDFSIPTSPPPIFGHTPSSTNFAEPGKRPLSAISPAIILHPNGSLFLIAGSAGSNWITTTTVQNIISGIDQNLGAQEILATPRVHHQLIPNHAIFETTYDNRTVDFLSQLGHEVTWYPPAASMAHLIRVNPDGGFDPAGDPRLKNSGGVVAVQRGKFW